MAAAAAAAAAQEQPYLDAGFSSAGAEAVGDPRIARSNYTIDANPCLDFFFEVVPGTPPQRVRDLLAAAWAYDPLTALKLAFNLRGVRGTGKSDKEGFYAAMLWMHDHHPKTLAYNLPALAEFGHLKDFPELLFRIIHRAGSRKLTEDKHLIRSEAAAAFKPRTNVVDPAAAIAVQRKRRGASPLLLFGRGRYLLAAVGRKRGRRPLAAVGRKRGRHLLAETTIEQVDTKMADAEDEHKGEKELSNNTSRRARFAMQALDTYNGDREYRFLFDHVAEFFADLLASDVKHMLLGEHNKIGLAAKWCPTPGSSFDWTTLLCEAIARRLFPRDSDDHTHRLWHEVLVPLRQVLQLPGVISSQRWSQLPYTNVVRRYKASFEKHNEEFKRLLSNDDEQGQFTMFLADNKVGRVKISPLLPHMITYICNNGEMAASEWQWRHIVGNLRENGLLSNSIAVCNMSKSMQGTQMDVSTVLGLLVSELSEYPWAGRLVTCSEEPKIRICMIKGKTLQDKLRSVQSMQCDHTDFQAVFNYILGLAKTLRLEPEKMVETVFVFSNKEFDEASARPWTEDYQFLCRSFQNAGYGAVVPQIVFWNLQASHSIGMNARRPGVINLRGFSNNLLKLFLENDGVVYPEDQVSAALALEEYRNLALSD